MLLKNFLLDNSLVTDDYICLLKFETLFNRLNKEKNFKFVNLNNDFDFKNIENEVEIIISSNPDCDFPPPKKNIIIEHSLDSRYGKELQKKMDNIDYYDKLQLDILDTIPRKIKKIYCHSVGYNIKGVNMIPLGRDWKNKNLFNIADKYNRTNKKILCYYNCTLPPNVTHWYGLIRKYIYNICLTKSFIYTDYCNIHPRVYTPEINLKYLKNLSDSKFMICPRGCGIDSYRMWDCIFMGCIPIVEKYDGYRQFEDLPILYIDTYKEIETFTEKFLEDKWEEMMGLDYNYDKLTMKYWITKINN